MGFVKFKSNVTGLFLEMDDNRMFVHMKPKNMETRQIWYLSHAYDRCYPDAFYIINAENSYSNGDLYLQANLYSWPEEVSTVRFFENKDEDYFKWRKIGNKIFNIGKEMYLNAPKDRIPPPTAPINTIGEDWIIVKPFSI